MTEARCHFCGAACATCCDSRWITTEEGPQPCPKCASDVDYALDGDYALDDALSNGE